MDEFDIIDLVYNYVAAADAGMPIYKEKSIAGEVNNHIVITSLDYHHLDWNNKLPVFVNIFVKDHPNGMPNRSVMKEAKSKIREELLKIRPKGGYYHNIEVQGSGKIDNAKEGFACRSIRIIITTEKNIKEYG